MSTRRDFLKTTAATGGFLVGFPLVRVMGQGGSPNDRPRIGSIGVGGRGSGIARGAREFGDIVAVCDVDRRHAEEAAADPKLGNGKAAVIEDYRKLLDDPRIDLVTIGTPDHWHTRICIDAMKAGKDLYCEKPLTLTIDEGKILRQVVKDTGRVFQVGTQQRSDYKNMFLTAVAMVRGGRIGKIKRVTCCIGGTSAAKQPFAVTDPPEGLNWDLWLGQAPMTPFIKERCHGTFRWWYEYSGGKLTDWGAHHVDIAQWAIGQDQSGPSLIEPVEFNLPVKFVNGYPTVDDTYNTVTTFRVRCQFPDEVEMLIVSDGENGITFEGTEGTFFVSRKELTGEPVNALASNPIPESELVALRKGKPISGHMANFIDCVRDRSVPVSDVASHHRAMSTCHLANIAMRLGRPVKWDPAAEQIRDDTQANDMLSRAQREGYEIKA